MNPHDHNVKVRKGANAWLLARTDRDEAERATVIASSGTFLNRVLTQASPAGLRGVFQTLATNPTGGRFVIGAARPVLVTASQTRPTRPDGLRSSSCLSESPFVRRVRAEQQWYLSVLFDWHGGDVQLPWPAYFAPVLGSELASDHQLDWLLLETFEAVAP